MKIVGDGDASLFDQAPAARVAQVLRFNGVTKLDLDPASVLEGAQAAKLGAVVVLRNNGYYGKTRGNRSLLHRDVWEAANGPIHQGYDIHHLDENKMNNEWSNLVCLPKAEHTRLYSPHNNQYTRGRKRVACGT